RRPPQSIEDDAVPYSGSEHRNLPRAEIIAKKHYRPRNKVLADSAEHPYKALMLQTLSEARPTTHSVNRKASVIWKGSLRGGTGTMSTESGVLDDTQYSFRTRLTNGIGRN